MSYFFLFVVFLIDDAKLQTHKNKKPLYRAYNRGYIGENYTVYQRVTLILENLVYLFRTCG